MNATEITNAILTCNATPANKQKHLMHGIESALTKEEASAFKTALRKLKSTKPRREPATTITTMSPSDDNIVYDTFVLQRDLETDQVAFIPMDDYNHQPIGAARRDLKSRGYKKYNDPRNMPNMSQETWQKTTKGIKCQITLSI